MGGIKMSVQVLLLSSIGIGLVSATSNTTEGPGLSENSKATTHTNGFQETCHAANLQDAIQRISAAVDTLTGELSCKRGKNASLTDEKSRMVEQNLRQIVESTLQVFFDLNNNVPGFDVLDIFGVLDSLRLGNDSDPEFIRLWFSVKMIPLLPYVNGNFLNQLSKQNFSCTSFQEIIQAFGSQKASMDRDTQQAVFTHFIKPFLSRNDSTDPGCVSSITGSQAWLKANLGDFSDFATVQDLQAFNPNLSTAELLSVLSPSQVAQLVLSLGASNNTDLIDRVFERLQEGNALKNVDGFLTQLTTNGQMPIFEPVVRDRIMNTTFIIISPHFSTFTTNDYELWFHVKLIPILASFTPEMLINATTKISCTNYQVIVSGLALVIQEMPLYRRQEITHGLLGYLRNAENAINEPACRQQNESDAQWVKANLGPFVQYTAYSDLKDFNISTAGLLSTLNPSEVAQLLLSSGASNNTDFIDLVFEQLEQGNALKNVDEFLTQLTANGQTPHFQPVVRDRVMNTTFIIISPHFSTFTTNDYELWFHVKLIPILASFTPEMLINTTTTISCTNYQVIVSGLALVIQEMPLYRRQEITHGLLGYLRNADNAINEPACRQQNESDAQWVKANLGPFIQYSAYSDLKDFNISTLTVLDVLSPSQKAELILDPNSGALNDAHVVREVLTSLTETSDYEQLNQFFQAFANINKQRNVTFIQNPDVRDTILNLTLTALAPQLKDFQPEDYQQWFRVYLVPVMASILPSSLRVIPSNITCESYQAIYDGLAQSLAALPLDLSQGVRSSKQYLQDTFPRCSVPASFVCKVTPVHVNLICDGVDGSKLEQILSAGNSSAALCNFTITEHACSSAPYLTSSNLVTLLNCTLKSQNIYPVEVWKLFFQKASAVLDQALETFANMASNNTYPTSSNVLEALGEVRIDNFNQAQLQSEEFITSWFKTKIRPFLAVPSFNFLFCLSSKNFSCQTYQTVIQAFGSQKASMDRDTQQAVFTHFIKPFLSRNDSTDPGCVSSITGSQAWLKANLGDFSDFATVQDLQAFNPNLSTAELLSVFSPSQMAQLVLSLGASNNTDLIDRVFERLQEGNALKNVDGFLTQLTANGQMPIFQPVVRDRVMNTTFIIISPHFSTFTTNDYELWFHVKLIPILASFTPEMLINTTTKISCTNYQVIVSGLALVIQEMPLYRRQEITHGLLGYLRNAENAINEPACRQQNESDAQWVKANLGPFVQYTAYSDLKDFNISTAGLLSTLNPSEVAQLLLSSGASNNTDFIDLVFEQLEQGNALKNVDEFLTQLTANGQTPHFQPVVRDRVMNTTFIIISPHFSTFTTNDYELWFHVKLIPILASFTPEMLINATTKISCTNYQVIVSGLALVIQEMPLYRRQEITHGLLGYLRNADNAINEPACRQQNESDAQWVKANLGPFVQYTAYSDLKDFNISTAGLLSTLNPSEVAQLLLSSGASNNTDFIDLVFEQLEQGNALKNVDEFLTQLTANGQTPHFQPVVRDRVMNTTFIIISPHFSTFTTNDYELWFHVKLIPILASFTPEMLINTTTTISCTNYQVIVSGLALVIQEMPLYRRQEITHGLLGYLRNADNVINEPACRQQNESDAQWVKANLGPFIQYSAYSDLKDFNISTLTVLDVLSPSQKAELILDPNSGALNDAHVVREVLTSLTETSDYEQLNQFFQAFANINKQRNVTFIQNPDVRDTILNLTLTALAPQLKDFQPEDYQQWFQVYLVPVMASILPSSLRVIPSNITCESYQAIYDGLAQSLAALPLDLSQGVRSSKQYLQDTFPRCSVPASFVCKVTPVHVNLICDGVDGSKLEQILSAGNSSAALCNFTITEHACSSAPYLTSSNLVTLLNCTLKSQNIYPVEVWKLFFQKASAVLDQALETFANMASNNTYPTSSNVLEALGEVRIDNFNQAQLQSEEFITSWFKTKIRPFLAVPSFNFLFCLSSKNFSCQTYQTVIQAFGSQKASMDRDTQQAVFTHFIKPFLSRNDSTDPGCVSSITGSQAWLKANLGDFSDFATVQDLQAFNPNLSTAELLSVFSPSQMAQLVLSLGASNNTDLIDRVFERLQEGNALKNVDGFLTQLTANGQMPIFQPVVRDRVMNTTFIIISPHFSTFTTNDYELWFHVKLIPILASFTPEMLINTTTKISCTNYQVIVSGLALVIQEMPLYRRQEITHGLLGYLRNAENAINEPACRQQNESDAQWVKANLGPFVQYTAYSDLKDFNISTAGLLSTLNPSEVAQLLLSSGASNNTDFIDLVFEQLEQGNALKNVDEFLTQLTANGQSPHFQPVVRDRVMNTTFIIISPHFSTFTTNDYELWFHVKLIPILASFTPEMLINATTTISCTNYQVIVSGLALVIQDMPLYRRQEITHGLLGYLRNADNAINEPACRQQNESDAQWVKAKLGPFVQYTAYSDLKDFNISTAGLLSTLNPSEVAQLLLSSGASNNTAFIDLVFEQLEQGNALKNVDEFLTQLTANGQTPHFQPVVRDRVMNTTFIIISPHFSTFTTNDYELWFHVKLIPILASFTPEMLINTTTTISCTNYQVIVSGLALVIQEMPLYRRQEITHGLLGYLRNADNVINEPACRQQNESDAQWVKANLGPFIQYSAYSDLKDFNISTLTVLDVLSPSQKAELILDPNSGALNDAHVVREVLTSLTETSDYEQLNQFFQAFANINKQRNVTFIQNPDVRDTILNLTLTALAPQLKDFQPEDYQQWFQVYLVPVMASILPSSLRVIPSNITCESYQAIYDGLAQSLAALPLDLSQGVRSSKQYLQDTFPRCSVPASFVCKVTPVHVNLICDGVDGSKLEQILSAGNSSAALCNFTITEHACSSAPYLTSSNLVTLLNCTLKSQNIYPVEVWKLFFQKASAVLDQALETFANMASNNTYPTSSNVLEALGEVRIDNFNQAQLQSEEFITSWFKTKIRPFLAVPSFNFLFCLSSKNFSCQTYQTVIQAFGSQKASMDRDTQQAVFTHFIKPFLSRNDSTDPGCVSSITGSQAWLKANLGDFSDFATVQDLQAFNPNLSTAELLSVFSPSQMAQLVLSLGASNNTDLIDRVFERLQEGNALKNVDGFLTQLTANGQMPIFQPVVRDRVMNTTFIIISPHFSTFTTNDYELWFHVKLIPILASFTPEMLINTTTKISCTNYQVIVSGLALVIQEMPLYRRQEITHGLLGYLRNAENAINEPACRQQNESDAQWVKANLGPFVQYTAYSDLKDFNISTAGLLSTLNPSEVAQLLLSSGASNNTDFIDLVFEQLEQGNALKNVDEFLTQLTANGQSPHFQPVVRDRVMNTTFIIISPHFSTFTTNDYELWFHVKLIPILASFTPEMLINATTTISCTNYQVIVSGLALVIQDMPLYRRQEITHGLLGYLRNADNAINEPACRQQNESDAQWVKAKLGPFVQYTAYSDLKDFNISTAGLLSTLNPSEVAQLLLSSGASNNTAFIDLVFEQLEQGNALKNVDEFLTQLTANGQTPHFQPVVRDRVMNTTFIIISPHFSTFTTNDYELWFHVKLIPILASFTPEMLINTTTTISCTNYQVIVSGLALVIQDMPLYRRQEITHGLLGYLRNADNAINEPACRQQNESDAQWVKANLGPFIQYSAYSDLKDFNISTLTVLDVLSPSQKAELILDPNSGALNDAHVVREVLTSLTETSDYEQLNQFFQAFANINKQRNVTFIQNPDVRDTILNLTLTALAPQLKDFQPEDYQQWFQVYLVPVMASILPSSLRVIRSNITCESYQAIYDGLAQSLAALPLDLSQGVRSSKQYLQDTFPRCSVPASFVCKVTPVHVNLICDGVDGSKLEQILSAGNSSAALCNFTITEHACSSAPYLTSSNLVTLLNCTLKSQNIYPVEVWKLFFQKASAVLDQALETFANMASNNTYPTSSNVLEALGEVRIDNFNQAQLQSEEFITSWFKTKIRPFLAVPSFNFLFCLSSKNFSCQTYQTVIQAFGSQKASMDRDTQQAVFTHFIKPFLSRNDSTDPGCVSSITGSQAWLKANLGDFSDFATVQDLQAFNPNLSTAELLSVLSPSQMAQLVLSLGASNNTDLIDRVFERLQEGNALKNVDGFLTQLTANGQMPIFQPVVRDRIMNTTFIVISPHFSTFTTNDYELWFHVKLIPILASFTPEMLINTTTKISCTNYQVIVSGLALVIQEMPLYRRQEITHGLLGYLRNAENAINEPACRQQNESDAQWVKANLGPFVQYTAYSDLKDFNISTAGLLSTLNPSEVAQLLLSSGASNNTDFIDLVFEQLEQGNALKNVDEFLTQLTANGQTPHFQPVVRDRVMNTTFIIISPHFSTFTTNDYELWFHVKLIPILASFTPEMLINTTTTISCTNYQVIVSGLALVIQEMPLYRRQEITRGLLGYLRNADNAINEPACRQQNESDAQWVKANLGPFVQYTAYSDLKDFNISTAGLLSTLNPSEVAQLLLSSGASNNTDFIDLVFEQLEQGNALKNVDEFLTQLTANGQSPHFQPVVRDRVMNTTFIIISPHFSTFTTNDYELWFHVKLIPILASFTPEMLINATTKISCTNYQVIVSGLALVIQEMPLYRRQEITHGLLGYLRNADNAINEPACRQQNESDAQWVKANLGPLIQYTSYSDLKDFNISTLAVLDVLSPSQKADLILDPKSGALNDACFVKEVLRSLTETCDYEKLNQFFQALAKRGC
ncbi:uncharacterized protein LOC143413942 [Maylandia zebra]|uniref:uncharacterized protein LOC143413942 n=1 Tax=Maylandia zebra TaxID=106582 RepID=UPI00403D200B